MQELLTPIILAIHLLLAFALIGVVLLQKSEGGLGGLGGGGMGGLMTGRSSANLLTKTTRWLAAGFMVTSLALAWIATHGSGPRSILTPTTTESPALPPAEVPQAPAPTAPGQSSSSPAQPVAPAGPSVPTTNQ